MDLLSWIVVGFIAVGAVALWVLLGRQARREAAARAAWLAERQAERRYRREMERVDEDIRRSRVDRTYARIDAAERARRRETHDRPAVAPVDPPIPHDYYAPVTLADLPTFGAGGGSFGGGGASSSWDPPASSSGADFSNVDSGSSTTADSGGGSGD